MSKIVISRDVDENAISEFEFRIGSLFNGEYVADDQYGTTHIYNLGVDETEVDYTITWIPKVIRDSVLSDVASLCNCFNATWFDGNKWHYRKE